MNLFLIGIGVCLAVAAHLPAQTSGRPSFFGETLNQQQIQTYQLEHGIHPASAASFARTGIPVASSLRPGVVSVNSLQHAVDSHAQRSARKAMREFGRRRFAEALPLLQKAVELDPRSSTYENNLGVLYCVLGDDPKALDAFQTAIAIDPNAAISYRNLAAVAFNTYQYKLAEDSARQAVRLLPDSEEAQMLTALSQVAQNHWTDEARRTLAAYRTTSAQAAQILSVWPAAHSTSSQAHTPSIRGAGPGAFRLSSHQ